MKTLGTISCLIPVYNEGERLFAVLDVVTQVPAISRVVCIDDGSDYDCSAEIRQRWPGVDVVRLPENQGKTAAIKEGVAQVTTDYVLLMDADLQRIDRAELERALQAVQQWPEIDMVIMRRVHAEWFVKFNRGDILLSGERILRRADLQTILNEPIEGFQLEVAINEYMQRQGKTVRWFPWSATNTYKMDKRGPVEGFLKDAKMYADILGYVGPVAYARQIARFARQPISGAS